MTLEHYDECKICGWRQWRMTSRADEPEPLPFEVTERTPAEMQCEKCAEAWSRFPELAEWMIHLLEKHGVLKR